MDINSVKVIECFNLKGRGLLTELQHSENGIPPHTRLINPETQESWIVKKRVLSGNLLAVNVEKIFDCETNFEHISHSYKTAKDKSKTINKELEKREKGIYWYLLAPETEKQTIKPEMGSYLKILGK